MRVAKRCVEESCLGLLRFKICACPKTHLSSVFMPALLAGLFGRIRRHGSSFAIGADLLGDWQRNLRKKEADLFFGVVNCFMTPAFAGFKQDAVGRSEELKITVRSVLRVLYVPLAWRFETE